MKKQTMQATRGGDAAGRNGWRKIYQTCHKVLIGIESARKEIFREFQDSVRGYEHQLMLALNEAEAVARESAYPHLLFPSLAREKAQATVSYRRYQRLVRQKTFTLSRAEY